MLRVPGTVMSLADAQAEGAKVHVVYSAGQAVELAERVKEPVVFFATGFETTAVATAAIVLKGLPDNLSILSAHKYIPPVMEIVAEMPDRRWRVSSRPGTRPPSRAGASSSRSSSATASRWSSPASSRSTSWPASCRLVELVRDGTPQVVNMYPRCVTREGNLRAQEQLWEVFEPSGGRWRGIARVPDGNLALRDDSPASTRGRGSRSTSRLSPATRRPRWPSRASAAAS